MTRPTPPGAAAAAGKKTSNCIRGNTTTPRVPCPPGLIMMNNGPSPTPRGGRAGRRPGLSARGGGGEKTGGGDFGRYRGVADAVRVHDEPVGWTAAARDVSGRSGERGGGALPGRRRGAGRDFAVSPREVRIDPGGGAADGDRGT